MIILSSAPSSWYLFQHFRSVIRLSGKAVGTIDAVLAVEYPAGEGEGSENGVEGVGDDGVDHSEDEKGRARERRVVLVLVQVVVSALEGTTKALVELVVLAGDVFVERDRGGHAWLGFFIPSVIASSSNFPDLISMNLTLKSVPVAIKYLQEI